MPLDLGDFDLGDRPAGPALRADLGSRVDAEADRFLSVAITVCVVTIVLCLMVAALL